MTTAPADSPSTSPGLLRLLGDSGNDAAWGRFLARYDPLIRGWCRAARLQPADADDVRAAVLAGLVRALRDFEYDPARRFRGYLRTAVNNAVYKARADRAAKSGNYGRGGAEAHPLDGLPSPNGPADPDGLAAALDDGISADLRALHRAVERVRAAVGPDTWRAYLLTAVEGRPAAEAAAAVGKSVAAVYMARSRVGRLLREALAGDPPAAGRPPR